MIRALNIAITLAGITMLSILAILTPSPAGFGTHQQIIPVPCLFYVVFNAPCPSCGITTSLSHLAHGDIINAFKTHPLGPVIFLSIVGIIIVSAVVNNRPWWNITEKRWFQNLILCGIGIYIIVWVLRILI